MRNSNFYLDSLPQSRMMRHTSEERKAHFQSESKLLSPMKPGDHEGIISLLLSIDHEKLHSKVFEPKIKETNAVLKHLV